MKLVSFLSLCCRFGAVEHVDGTNDGGLVRLDWVCLVLLRGCGAGELIDLIDIEVYSVRDVVRMGSKLSWSIRWETFLWRSVENLPRQLTRAPSAMRRSQRCDPRKPAPPVTRQVRSSAASSLGDVSPADTSAPTYRPDILNGMTAVRSSSAQSKVAAHCLA